MSEEEAPAPAPVNLEESQSPLSVPEEALPVSLPASVPEEVAPVVVESVPTSVLEEVVPVSLDEKIEVPVQLEESILIPAPEVVEVIPESSAAIEVVEVIPESSAAIEEVQAVEIEPISITEAPAIVESVKGMAPQKYADLGKEARDLISKNFHFGALKLEVKTKGKDGMEFTTEGSHNTDTGNVAASFETKFKYAPYGLSLTDKWSTDNVIALCGSVDNKLLQGLKVDLDTSYAPFTGQKSVKVKTDYQHGEVFHGTADIDFVDFSGPTVHGSGVLGYKGFHAGYQASYDIANSKLLDNNVSLTYKNENLVFHTAVLNASKYVGSIHHQVNKDLSAAALLNWASDSTTFTLCGKYAADEDSCWKAKVDNSLRIGCAYVQKLRPGVQLTMSGLLNAKSLEQGGHKIGLSLNLEA